MHINATEFKAKCLKHIWLWYAEGIAGLLKPGIVSQIEDALLTNRLHVSTVSVWEVGLLVAKNRITLSAPVKDWVQHATTLSGLCLHPLDWQSALENTYYRVRHTPTRQTACWSPRRASAATRCHARPEDSGLRQGGACECVGCVTLKSA